jgi:hypothetical protein
MTVRLILANSTGTLITTFKSFAITTVKSYVLKGPMSSKFFTNVCNKQGGFSLASLSSIVCCLRIPPGPYPRVEKLKGVSLG